MRVIECAGNCADEGAPNQICQSNFGSEWKASAVDCEIIQSGTGSIDRTMDDNIDWCQDGGGEDVTVTCYK